MALLSLRSVRHRRSATARATRRPDRRTRPGRAVALLRWFDAHARPLPWRRDRDPYRIWVAEVLLQQTRVAQAIPYYERFVRRFPDVVALAAAPLEEVLKVWEGAGYYGRARNLHAAARRIVADGQGRIPSTVAELRELPGVGPYIANAVASLAFGARVAAVEANGLRVAARWSLERRALDRSLVRRRLARVLEAEVPPDRPGAFNEAVMELGETVCLPAVPHCPECPVADGCRAHDVLEDPGSIPPTRRRPARPHVVAAVAALERDGRWLVQERPAAGLLGGLWEFPGGKVEHGETPEAACRRELKEEVGVSVRKLEPVGVVRHGYSHFTVELHVFRCAVDQRAIPPRPSARWLTPTEFARRPRPKATEKVVDLLVEPGSGRGAPGPGLRRRRGSVRAD